ncbi:MAG: Ig-like domain-containing protein [Clostridiaceae bacterium]
MNKRIKSIFVFLLSLVFLLSYISGFKNIVKADTNDVGVSYQAHVQDIGWQPSVQDGAMAGTEGKDLRLETLKINLTNAPSNAHIKYRAHVESIGWQNEIQDGAEAGTSGKGLRLEALKITLENLPGYSVQYRAHVQNIGWQNWVSDGTLAGTEGRSLKIEAIQIKVVKINTQTYIPVTSIKIKTNATLPIGGTDLLPVTFTPSNATNQNVKWLTSNSNVVTVDSNGVIIGKTKGAALITAISEDGGKTAYCIVSVNPVSVTGVSLDKEDSSVIIGGSTTLTPSIAPENATNQGVKWTTSDATVATVTNGVVKGLKIGTVTITATTLDGSFSDKCTITVTDNPDRVTGIDLDKTKLTLILGNSDLLTATIAPSTAKNKDVIWQSSNTNVATVKGGLITAVNVGTTIITATSADGGQTSTCVITVTPVKVTEIKIKSTTTLALGGVEVLYVTFNPSNATNQNVKWITSNSNIVTVDSNGVIKGKSKGTATITAISEDGGKTSSCIVTVSPTNVTSVTLNKHTDNITVGNSTTLIATVAPSNATNKSVTWTSSDSTIATVVDGVVKGINPGIAIITVTSGDGLRTDKCIITVTSN